MSLLVLVLLNLGLTVVGSEWPFSSLIFTPVDDKVAVNLTLRTVAGYSSKGDAVQCANNLTWIPSQSQNFSSEVYETQAQGLLEEGTHAGCVVNNLPFLNLSVPCLFRDGIPKPRIYDVSPFTAQDGQKWANLYWRLDLGLFLCQSWEVSYENRAAKQTIEQACTNEVDNVYQVSVKTEWMYWCISMFVLDSSSNKTYRTCDCTHIGGSGTISVKQITTQLTSNGICVHFDWTLSFNATKYGVCCSPNHLLHYETCNQGEASTAGKGFKVSWCGYFVKGNVYLYCYSLNEFTVNSRTYTPKSDIFRMPMDPSMQVKFDRHMLNMTNGQNKVIYTISWKPIDDVYSQKTGFTYRLNITQLSSEVFQTNSSTIEYAFDLNSTYHIELTASDGDLMSYVVSKELTTVSTAPSHVQVTAINYSCIHITWYRPDDLFDNIINYRVSCSNSTAVLNVSDLYAIECGFQAMTVVSCNVFAVFHDGETLSESSNSVETPCGRPSAVKKIDESVEFSADRFGNLIDIRRTISWQPVHHNCKAFLHYNLTSLKNGASNSVLITSAQFIFRGFALNESHTVVLYAVNDEGLTGEVLSETFLYKEETPMAAPLIYLNATNSSCATISIEQSCSDNSTLRYVDIDCVLLQNKETILNLTVQFATTVLLPICEIESGNTVECSATFRNFAGRSPRTTYLYENTQKTTEKYENLNSSTVYYTDKESKTAVEELTVTTMESEYFTTDDQTIKSTFDSSEDNNQDSTIESLPTKFSIRPDTKLYDRSTTANSDTTAALSSSTEQKQFSHETTRDPIKIVNNNTLTAGGTMTEGTEAAEKLENSSLRISITVPLLCISSLFLLS